MLVMVNGDGYGDDGDGGDGDEEEVFEEEKFVGHQTATSCLFFTTINGFYHLLASMKKTKTKTKTKKKTKTKTKC